MSDKADVIRKWYEDVWIAGDIDRIADIYQPADDKDCLIEGSTEGPEGSRFRIVVVQPSPPGTDPHVSAIILMDGQRTDTGAPVQMRWITYVRVADGRIVESYPSVNFLSFFEQLGQLPENTFELLLGGTVLR